MQWLWLRHRTPGGLPRGSPLTVRVTLEGLDEFGAAWGTAVSSGRTELAGASLEAAAEGIREAREDHPYTDRTGHLSGIGDGGGEQNSHAEQTDDGEAEMVWPVEYAGFVDQGTSRNRPYPFTPQARERAEAELQRKTQDVADGIAARVK